MLPRRCSKWSTSTKPVASYWFRKLTVVLHLLWRCWPIFSPPRLWRTPPASPGRRPSCGYCSSSGRTVLEMFASSSTSERSHCAHKNRKWNGFLFRVNCRELPPFCFAFGFDETHQTSTPSIRTQGGRNVFNLEPNAPVILKEVEWRAVWIYCVLIPLKSRFLRRGTQGFSQEGRLQWGGGACLWFKPPFLLTPLQPDCVVVFSLCCSTGAMYSVMNGDVISDGSFHPGRHFMWIR